MTIPTVLVVDDDPLDRAVIEHALAQMFHVVSASSSTEARTQLTSSVDAVILDLRLRKNDDDIAESLDFLRFATSEFAGVPVIVHTGFGDLDIAVSCMRLGAVDFIEKGRDAGQLAIRLQSALQQGKLRARLRTAEHALAIVAPRALVGESAAIVEVRERISAAAADGRVTVLVTGETGTGKEVVARAIHASGERSEESFMAVAVPTLPPATIESELFGHEPGAFTDARKLMRGYVERANRGVLFLDEIGDLSMSVQVKLLRFLEEREIVRLGGQRTIPIDVQIIAATNIDLAERCADGRFREDLYYRLKVYEIHLPPLRERPDDIPLLVEHYMQVFGRAGNPAAVSNQAMDVMCRFHWPGNIRQLRNVVEAAVITGTFKRKTVIEPEDLPQEVRRPAAAKPDRGGGAAARATVQPRPGTLDEISARAELEAIRNTLELTNGRKIEAGRLLGLGSRYALRRRVERLLARHPELGNEFPEVRLAFSGADPTG